jgi:GAF domain-containing protein
MTGTGLPAAPGWALDEEARARALAELDLASHRDSEALARIVAFAAALCDVPTSAVSIVEARRQAFIARVGLEPDETPRETSFCAHAMAEDDVMVVPDATADPRFADNPLVTGDPRIRFYAGAPLVTAAGMPLGSLCVIDTQPRAGLTALQRQGLRVLAADVVNRFEKG